MATERVLFRSECTIDVTDFDAKPGDYIGYTCRCIIEIFSTGRILFSSGSEILEDIDMGDIVMASDNVNNYDPVHALEISIMTEEKDVRTTFRDKKLKTACWRALRLCTAHSKVE